MNNSKSTDRPKPLAKAQGHSAGPDPLALATRIKGRGPAPVHLWNPPFCGDMDLLITRNGAWIHEGRPIRRPAMVSLFASILMRGEDGHYYLVTPVEKVRIRVEDCPFVALGLERRGKGKSARLEFTTNTGDVVTADREHPIRVDTHPRSGEPHPVIYVRNGLDALINRPVFYQLVNMAEQRNTRRGPVLGVRSAGEFFDLGACS